MDEVAPYRGGPPEDGWDVVLLMPCVDDVLEDEASRTRSSALSSSPSGSPAPRKGARVPKLSFGRGRRASVDQGSVVSWGAVLGGTLKVTRSRDCPHGRDGTAQTSAAPSEG